MFGILFNHFAKFWFAFVDISCCHKYLIWKDDIISTFEVRIHQRIRFEIMSTLFSHYFVEIFHFSIHLINNNSWNLCFFRTFVYLCWFL